jgi:hypothetical protein
MNATEWLDKVVIYNEDHSIHYQDISQWDETFILVEVIIRLYSHIQEFHSKVAYTCKITTFINLIHYINIQLMCFFLSFRFLEVET